MERILLNDAKTPFEICMDGAEDHISLKGYRKKLSNYSHHAPRNTKPPKNINFN